MYKLQQEITDNGGSNDGKWNIQVGENILLKKKRRSGFPFIYFLIYFPCFIKNICEKDSKSCRYGTKPGLMHFSSGVITGAE